LQAIIQKEKLQIMREMKYKLIIIVTSLFFVVSQESFAANDTKGQFETIINRLSEIRFSKPSSEAKVLISELYEICAAYPEDNNLATQTVYWETLINFTQGDIDTTLEQRIKNIFETINEKINILEYALLNHTLALNYTLCGDYASAFTTSLKTLDIFTQLNDSAFIIRTLSLLGTICFYIQSLSMAEDYYNQALQYYSPVTQKEFFLTKLNLFSAWSYSGRIQEAIDSLCFLLIDLEAYGDPGLLAMAYANLGGFYSVTANYQNAEHCFDLLSTISPIINNSKISIVYNQNMSINYYFRGDLKNALYYSIESKKIAEQKGNMELLAPILSNLSQIYFELNNIDSAYSYLSRYNQLSTKLSGNSKTIEAYRSYISVYLEASQSKLTIAQQQVTIRNRQIIILLISTLAATILVILLLIIIRQKKHQELLLQESLEAKLREISSSSLMLIQKNTVLQQISDITKQYENEERDKELVKEINSIVKLNLSTNFEQNNFMVHFNKVQPNFFDKLKFLCDELTEQNLRMCAYSRIGLSTKEIGQMLNILPDAVRTHRYRIKKKLGLAEEDSLDDFLRNI